MIHGVNTRTPFVFAMTFCRMDPPPPAPQRVRIATSSTTVSVGVYGGVSNGVSCWIGAASGRLVYLPGQDSDIDVDVTYPAFCRICVLGRAPKERTEAC